MIFIRYNTEFREEKIKLILIYQIVNILIIKKNQSLYMKKRCNGFKYNLPLGSTREFTYADLCPEYALILPSTFGKGLVLVQRILDEK